MLTILADNRSTDKTMWVFERKDLPYGRAGYSMDDGTPPLPILRMTEIKYKL